MSSAEDKTSSSVLPSQGSSNPAPEEFPVDARQEPANEGSSSSPSGGDPTKVESKTHPSPEQSPEEPGDDADVPLKTKPLPKMNAAAREIRVKVTGARVGSAFIERELFTESTATVLVFEKGGVIRLTAAVSPGQLLFLTNEESQREIVAQVMRKRAYRPTECYVEFEFTEPAPGFWGMEFSAATALLPQDKNVAAAAEMISSAETTDDELDAAPPHSAEEVEALKREVEALRSQLNLLQTQPEPSQVAPTATTPNTPASPLDTRPPEAPKAGAPSYQSEKAPWTELSADVAPVESEPKPSPVYSPDQDSLHKPALVFRKSMLPPKRSFRARGEFTPGFRAGMLRLAVLSAVLAALIGFAWYKQWFPWMHQSTKFSVSSFAGGVTTKVATPRTATSGSASLETQPTKAGTGAGDTVSAKEANPPTGASSEHSPEAAVEENEMAPYEVVKKPATREKGKPAASIVTKPSQARSLPTKMVASTPSSAANPGFVPPKLIKSEPAVATLDDLRDFETGSVVIDAFIDTDGSVGSMTVLTGPPSLRRPALQALKNYKYEPATQNGHPIASHVTVKIQFHFE